MQGFYELALYETPGLTPERVRAARKAGKSVRALLDEFPLVQKLAGRNLCVYRTPGYFFYQAMSAPDPEGYTYHIGFNLVALHTTSVEPDYQDYYSAVIYGNQNALPQLVTTDSTAYKYSMSGDIVEPYIRVDPDFREAVLWTSKWLWLPGEATSNAIRTIRFWNQENHAELLAQIRIRDSGGNPVTLSKTNAQTLFLAYTLIIPAI